MQVTEAEVLFRPSTSNLKFLPEGPMELGPDRISWVAIQHGADSSVGSLNILDAKQGNTNFDLPGRPGFAIPYPDGSFLIGMERHVHVGRIQGDKIELEKVSDEVDADVQNTIINDGTDVPGGVVFGTKDLKFEEKKAGLYYWQMGGGLQRLRDDQICSNGKELRIGDSQPSLIDIDSPTKQIVEYPFDLVHGTLGEPRVLVDLNDEEVFPDGLVLTPDGEGFIVALYNPTDVEAGEARQYSFDGQLRAVWKTPGAPQVTCPLLTHWGGKVQLVLTTAVEHMSEERQQQHENSGCLFIAPTPFKKTQPDNPYRS